MRDPMRVLWTLKDAMGVALLVPYWPSRKRIAELETENAELLRERREMRRVVTLAAASADSVLQASAVCRRNRL